MKSANERVLVSISTYCNIPGLGVPLIGFPFISTDWDANDTDPVNPNLVKSIVICDGNADPVEKLNEVFETFSCKSLRTVTSFPPVNVNDFSNNTGTNVLFISYNSNLKSNVSLFILTGTFAVNVISFGENDDSCAALKLTSAICHVPPFIMNTNAPFPSLSGLKFICCLSYFLNWLLLANLPICFP